jgi:GT2 family glycosyltransferase
VSSTVAIINWNSGRWLRTCVESLLASTEAEILVIDNASQDASLEAAEEFRNRATFVRNDVNRGFAAAVNQAFLSTSKPYVLILNPDIRVTPGAVQMLEDFLDTHPKAGAVGGHVGDKYLPRAFPTVGKLVLENLGMSNNPSAVVQPNVRSVDQPAAAALMIRRAAFDDVSGFDEQFYPAWYEDVDFCRRLKAKDWEIYFMPAAEFIHEGGYSADAMGSENFARSYYRNQMRYARKHFSTFGSGIVRASIAAGMIGRMIGRPSQAAAYGKVFIGALKGW